jgi:type VI protein secretion system component VasF
MYTSAECRAQAEEKLAEAEHDNQHRNRLITAAEAWLFLAGQLRRVEASFVPERARRITAWWIEPSA